MAAPSDDAFFNQLRIEHEELLGSLQAVSQSLVSPQRTQHSVQIQILSLSEAIEEHFTNEEEHGYLSALVSRSPQFTSQVAKLRGQHEALLERASKLQLLARSGLESAAWWQQIERDFALLRTELLQHERQENDLLQEALKQTSHKQ